jgi:uncharacterized membrane protein
MRTRHDIEGDYDVTAMIAKPLYFGMLVNILIPAALLFICYYLERNYYVENRIPGAANALFYIFCAVAFAQAVTALWWRNKSHNAPMIRREESFEYDVTTELLRRSKPVFLLIASISVWGYIYFGLTGRFSESVVYVVFSFIVFQFVRPRYGSVERLIYRQEQFVKVGEYMGGGLGRIRKEIEVGAGDGPKAGTGDRPHNGAGSEGATGPDGSPGPKGSLGPDGSRGSKAGPESE